MQTLSLVIDIILATYVIREVVRFGAQYRQLKRDIAQRRPEGPYACLPEGDRV